MALSPEQLGALRKWRTYHSSTHRKKVIRGKAEAAAEKELKKNHRQEWLGLVHKHLYRLTKELEEA